MQTYVSFVNGKWSPQKTKQKKSEIRSPYTHKILAEMFYADSSQVEEVRKASIEAYLKFRHSTRFERAQLLEALSRGIERDFAKFTDTIIEECGKPRTLAELEVKRALGIFQLASEEARRFTGELLPLDGYAPTQNFSEAIVRRVPRGPVLGIIPYNFPLNLLAHKVAPALAVGASIVVKPPPQAPGAALLLAKIFEEYVATQPKIPKGIFQILLAEPINLEPLISEAGMAVLSFTGSDSVGWSLHAKAHKKKVILELGGNAAVIVHEDADPQHVARRVAFGAFAYAGQICISVQRVFVHEKIEKVFLKYLLDETKNIPVGDPANKKTLCGPLIHSEALERVSTWVKEAVSGGAEVLYGGKILDKENIFEPTLLKGAKESAKVNSEEIFGPVLVLESYKDHKVLTEKINKSRYGLQAGVFTQQREVQKYVAEHLDVGAVIFNEIPTFRSDAMPYGGVKDSGLGREGVRFAMEEYTQLKTLVYCEAQIAP